MSLALSGELSFATATEQLARVRAAIADGSGPLQLDLSAVTRSDSAGLALLLEVTRLARAGGRELRVTGTPDQVRRLAEFFGLSGLLPLSA